MADLHTKALPASPRRLEGCCRLQQRSPGPEDKLVQPEAHLPARPARPILPRLRMCPFEPRAFPPPELKDVPLVYVLEQLRNLAPYYWSTPETADCTLIIPVTDFSRADAALSLQSPSPHGNGTVGSSRRTHDPSGLGRRATEPAILCQPPLVMNLHVDYLAAHSSLLRALFGGASPLDLINTSALPPSIGAQIMPRILPTSEAKHPKIYLPVPDPASFPLLAHWCYFRSFPALEEQLKLGAVRWDGLARNAEYLGLGLELKYLLGAYFAHHAGGSRVPPNSPVGSDSELSDAGSWSSDEDTMTESDCPCEDEVEDEPPRGRTTAVRNIGSRSVPALLLHARSRAMHHTSP